MGFLLRRGREVQKGRFLRYVIYRRPLMALILIIQIIPLGVTLTPLGVILGKLNNKFD